MIQYYTLGSQGICPDGWHPPSDDEWMLLEMYLGMTRVVAESTGWRGTDEGTQLKVNGSSGFEVLMGHMAQPGTSFGTIGDCAFFWTTSVYNSQGWYRNFHNSMSNISRSYFPKEYGVSVRCIKDE